eukprot:TRINITY_DN10789_c0_g1_i5.p2 TRINITY_DN10789_c0_g1~~TRINITY_DN10789_c0_g1_i5.p2  ORF type:complete len:178 (+),score=11.97 TRINITY_DN10789_c0_g1_i5:1246-1779(+)
MHHIPIQIKRGSRQGDSISRYLFNIAVNYLDSLFNQKAPSTGAKLFSGCKIKALFYCDDTVLVANSDSEIQTFLEILEEFSSLSGLFINKSKCTMFNKISNTLYRKQWYQRRVREVLFALKIAKEIQITSQNAPHYERLQHIINYVSSLSLSASCLFKLRRFKNRVLQYFIYLPTLR